MYIRSVGAALIFAGRQTEWTDVQEPETIFFSILTKYIFFSKDFHESPQCEISRKCMRRITALIPADRQKERRTDAPKIIRCVQTKSDIDTPKISEIFSKNSVINIYI